jgi:hypothetical protein
VSFANNRGLRFGFEGNGLVVNFTDVFDLQNRGFSSEKQEFGCDL